jgi:hypothetical protein
VEGKDYAFQRGAGVGCQAKVIVVVVARSKRELPRGGRLEAQNETLNVRFVH